VEAKKEVKQVTQRTPVNKELDIDRLAYAVAMAETHNCTK
jgi:hypothetical protein